MNAMTEAKEYAIANRTPVIVQANCVRIGSHSNSDKHTLYRDENELTYVKSADPLYKFHRMLIRYGRFTEEELKEIADLAAKDLKAANRKAMAAPIPIRLPSRITSSRNLITSKIQRRCSKRGRRERNASYGDQQDVESGVPAQPGYVYLGTGCSQ